MFLDRFQESWLFSSGAREVHPIVRLRSSLRSAAKRFQRTFGRHQYEEEPDLVGPAWLTFCAVTISANRAYCVWLGENGIHLFSPTGELQSNRRTPKKLPSRQWPAPGSSIHSGQKFEFHSSVWELPTSGQLILSGRRSFRPREPSECQTLIGFSNQQGKAWLTRQSQLWKWYCLIAYQSPDFQPIVDVAAKQPSWLSRLAFWR